MRHPYHRFLSFFLIFPISLYRKGSGVRGYKLQWRAQPRAALKTVTKRQLMRAKKSHKKSKTVQVRMPTGVKSKRQRRQRRRKMEDWQNSGRRSTWISLPHL